LGLRGLGANRLTRWRRLAERQRKHSCRYCKRLFSGRRSDAKFCGDSCKSLDYLRRRKASADRLMRSGFKGKADIGCCTANVR